MKITAKSEVFARARIVQGLSQRDLARRAGLSHSYISLLERSVKPVGPATAKRLSDLLQRQVEELFEIH
ncbi:helix-turn-helix domain-containing protein [Paenibacillus chartarius]|uniref:Helix-turn-helix domain-containing protein n=1 Tax=Paenibacillus chartarius TaxID=747481 RepID=A0ABV6DEP6_9BACL